MNPETDKKSDVCGEKTEVFSRVCGYFRPVSNWNRGKQEEFNDRKEFEIKTPCNCCSHE